ncbi:MAG TPA: O-acetyl-ADP-ribose deacetylase [Rhodanobacter sp.]|nr:O-acetyl-ADP-ribose deacetylase [Rhodanobacter sp.]
MPMRVIQADITRLDLDAIVNAANPTLLGGGGVDGAIHRAAGPALLRACRDLPESTPGVRCRTGEARITPGFDLPARYVIHTVGPIWHGGNDGEPRMLERCYRHALQLLHVHQLHTIAFPAISCGVYGYPVAAAARVAVTTLCDELGADGSTEVILCCFSNEARVTFQLALEQAMPDR